MNIISVRMHVGTQGSSAVVQIDRGTSSANVLTEAVLRQFAHDDHGAKLRIGELALQHLGSFVVHENAGMSRVGVTQAG